MAPPTDGAASAGKDDDDRITLAQAIANADAITPKDPMTALLASPAPRRAPGRRARPAPARVAPPAQQQPPVAPPAQQPPPAPPAQEPTRPATPTFSSDVPGSGQKVYTGHPINFDFEDADLRAVLRVFANESGLNMIIDPQVQGRVNVLLNDVPWDQALDQILRANKLGLHRRRQHPSHRPDRRAQRASRRSTPTIRRSRRSPASSGCRPSP